MLAVLIMLLLVVLLLVNAAGVVLVMLQLPGTWLIVVATAAMALWPATEIGWLWVAVLLALAGVGELIEFLASAHGARKAGATRRAAVGSLIGGVVGAIVCTFLIPIIVVGTLIGACAGAGIGS